MANTPSPEQLPHKELFTLRRKEFWENPQSQADLDAYRRRDNAHEYTVLKGLIPSALVGKETPGGRHWEKSDTFFSDYEINNPGQILSTSKKSLVIANLASHDTRQYLKQWSLDGKDRTAAAGMSFMHLLVIPKARIYNAVALRDTVIIDEMIAHFRRFWSSPGSADKIIGCLEKAVERRAKEVREALKPANFDLLEEFEITMKDVQASSNELADKLRECQKSSQDDDGLLFAFHPAPHATIAQLHMHVILKSPEFCKFSTRSHDWKTVPVPDIVDVIREDQRWSSSLSKSWWKNRLLIRAFSW